MNKHEKAEIQRSIQDDSLAKAAKILIGKIIEPREQTVKYRAGQVIIDEEQVNSLANNSSALLGTFSSESVIMVAKRILTMSAMILSSHKPDEDKEDYSI